MDTAIDSRIDRLYRLLPAIYRMRDAEQGYPLQALLRVIAEQVNIVEDDIDQLYNNWFVETAEDWAVPYIADLIGYRPVLNPGEAGNVVTREGQELIRTLIPRREVANTIRYRRRKGTLSLLELLAGDVADWPARAVEFFKLLNWHQNLDHRHEKRARTVDLRQLDNLDLLNGPFDRIAHTVDIRRINSARTVGRYNIPSVGVFIWRLKSYSVTRTPAHRPEHAPAHCGAFSILGQDFPLFINPAPQDDASYIAEELNLPAPIRRSAFFKHPERYYGPGKSIVIWADGWADFDSSKPIPVEKIKPADLSGWHNQPPLDYVAVDPVLGRFAFHPDQFPQKGVQVSYQYAFSSDIGGGEYGRLLSDPFPRQIDIPDPNDASKTTQQTVEPVFYRVGKGQPFSRLSDALREWRKQKYGDAVIELMESNVYTVEPMYIVLDENRALQIRAASGVRPILRLRRRDDWQAEDENGGASPESLTVTVAEGSSFTMDGLLVTAWTIYFTSPGKPSDQKTSSDCLPEISIRHCTLVPGWAIDCDCEPMHSEEPSLVLNHVRARIRIGHSIVGSIQIHEDEVQADPVPIHISDSIIDSTDPETEAIGAPGCAVAHAVLTIRRCTVFGIVAVHAIILAENSIFSNCVNVARRQLGCMRFCYVPSGCRTPKRYRCQPDLVKQSIEGSMDQSPARDAFLQCELLRLIPQFTSMRYGNPGYAQLAESCAEEIRLGADDESEMGIFHDLFQPQRTSNLQVRLGEYTPAGMDVGIIFGT